MAGKKEEEGYYGEGEGGRRERRSKVAGKKIPNVRTMPRKGEKSARPSLAPQSCKKYEKRKHSPSFPITSDSFIIKGRGDRRGEGREEAFYCRQLEEERDNDAINFPGTDKQTR